MRCFDFWRLDDVKPYRDAIDDKLREAAEKAGKEGILLVLENEFECNTATGRESARTLGAIKSSSLALNWDPGNAVMRGEMDAYPTAWEMLPKNRIHHCHVKNAVKNDAGKVVWAPTGQGVIDWTGQFRALKSAGFRDAVSLETHWHGAATPEESSRVSWAGMKKALIGRRRVVNRLRTFNPLEPSLSREGMCLHDVNFLTRLRPERLDSRLRRRPKATARFWDRTTA